MVLTLCIWIPLAIFINGIILIAIVRQVKSEINTTSTSDEDPVEFIVLGDSHESYETFLALTYKLGEVRNNIPVKDVSDNEYEELLNELDGKILRLQEVLAHMNTDGIPNPDVLTKRYIQESILQTLMIRVIFEKLNGRFLNDNNDEDFNVLKLAPSKKPK